MGTATITASDSILVEPQVSEGSGVGQVTCLFGDAPSQAESSGADFVSCPSNPGNSTGNSSSSPAALFAPGADWHLLSGSAALDSGSAAALAGGESATDLDGNPRVADGNLDCLVRRDKGAYELTGQSAPCPPADPAPVVRRFSLTNKVFRAAGERGRGSARRPAPIGTTFRWQLSEAGRVSIAIERKGTGRRAGGPVARPPARPQGPPLHPYTLRGRLSARAETGRGSQRFDGRLRRKALPPGSYRGVMVATDGAGQKSKARRIAFKIVRG